MYSELTLKGLSHSGYNQLDTDAALRASAVRLFERMLVARKPSRFNFIASTPKLLKSLADVELKPTRQHHGGLQLVSMQSIVGSEGRTLDFNANFRPCAPYLENRWVNLAIAMMNAVPLPPVELIRIGDGYYVRDGHHRISVARAFGQEDIMAAVTVWELPEDNSR
jgi:hypothetical protein